MDLSRRFLGLGEGEDEGWLVTYLHEVANGKSEMVIVDARDFAAPGDL